MFYIIDCFYIIDLIIGFFRSFYNYDEILIKTVPEMVCNYIKNWFLLDIFAAIPFSSIFFFEEHNKLNTIYYKNNLEKLHYFTHFGVKLDKMHYLLFMNKLLKIFKCFSDNNRALNKLVHILFKYNIIEEKIGIFVVIFVLLVSIHFGTCIFIFIGRNSYPSWINTIRIENKSFYNIYICSLYYLITTITTVGYGDIYGRTIQEILFQIILLIIGTCTYSFLISSVSNYIKKINEKSLIFENKLKILNDIKLTNPYMEENLYDKILRFLKYKKNTEKNMQDIIINSLPYSLKNNLLVEMYKPIINNFIIFKGLENSNCIVQLVTAFKPIYAIKNDILIQEGDFIEEVIFIKAGIISLEIGIDFNKPKESIIQYLNRIENRSSPNDANNQRFDSINKTLTDTSSFFRHLKSSMRSEKKEIKNMHYLKVVDIRKNEHFGETLMFLNERSFLTAKVKSKKAELFFLKKEEVIKVFNNFPNIWNRINRKSIYNMKQIKITVKKVLMNFCSMSGIIIDNDKEIRRKSILKNRIKTIEKEKENEKEIKSGNKYEGSKLNNNNELNNSNIKDKEIIEEKIEDEEKNQSLNNSQSIGEDNNKCKNSGINFLDKNNNDSQSHLMNNSILSKSLSIKQKNVNSSKISINNDSNELSINSKHNFNLSCFKRIKNKSPSCKENSNKEEENEINGFSSKETVKISMNKKPCSLIDSESLKEENELLDINFEVNDEIYKNEDFNLNLQSKSDLLKNDNHLIHSYLNNNIKIEDLSKKILEKTWINNLDKEKSAYLEKEINKNNTGNIILEKLEKIEKLENSNRKIILSFESSPSKSSLNLIKSEIKTLEIKAAYENINEITSHKYIKNSKLRDKTKEFLLKESACDLSANKIGESRVSSEHFVNKSTIFENNIILNKLKKFDKESINRSERLPMTSKQNHKIGKRGTISTFGNIRRGNTSKKINNLSTKKYDKKFMNISQQNNIIGRNQSLKRRSTKNILRVPQNRKKSSSSLANNINNKDKLIKSAMPPDDNMSFYDKYNTNKNNFEFIERKKTIKKRKKPENTELEEIKHIIKQDAQNLNNPSLYYQQLFLNHIQKRRDNNNYIYPESNTNTLLPIKRNKNANSLNLNIDRIKRTSTDLKNVNNKNFGLSLKQNYKRSSVVYPNKL